MYNTQTSSEWSRFLNGRRNFPFVAHREKSYLIALGIVVFCGLMIAVRGFTLGIDFEGGTKISLHPQGQISTQEVGKVFTEATSVTAQSVQEVGSGQGKIIEISSEHLTPEQIVEAKDALLEEFKPIDSSGKVSLEGISDSTISESWGDTITKRMLLALGVFLLVVFIYIAIRFTRVMASSAILCVLFDLTTVSGLYALFGFEVSPATVIGLLTILAYSLYDTVVVFDKINENTEYLYRQYKTTFADEVNRAINQTVIRSINTSIFSVFPIMALFIVAVGILGVGTLKDLALVQILGVLAGTLSSLFLAGPMVVSFSSKDKKIQRHDRQVAEVTEGRSDAETLVEEENARLSKKVKTHFDVAPPENLLDGYVSALPPEFPDTEESVNDSEKANRTWRPGQGN